MQLDAPEAEVKVKVKKRPKNLFRRVIILAIGLYLVLVLYRTVHSTMDVYLADAVPIPYGLVYSSVQVSGTVIRDEKVHLAPRGGTLKVIIPEGEKVRVGETVAQVAVPSFDSKSGETFFDIRATRAGIVSYVIDGLEEVYSPDTLSELDLDKIAGSEVSEQKLQAGAKVTQGKPVLKIVNNLKPLYVVGTLTQQQKLAGISEGSLVPVALAENDTKWHDAKLRIIGFRDRANQILFTLDKYSGNMVSSRKREFFLITERQEGYYVPAEALVVKEGQEGIFTIYKERVRWEKVEVKGKLNGKAVISGIAPTLKVILHPEYVQEGDPFRL